MTDRESFIAAIRAEPEDDLPLLIFADWLDERGDEATAKGIRVVSIRIAQTTRALGRLGDLHSTSNS